MQSPPQLAVAAPAPRIRTGHRRVAVLLLGVATVAYVFSTGSGDVGALVSAPAGSRVRTPQMTATQTGAAASEATGVVAPAEPKTVGERLIEGQVDEAAMFEASTFPIKPPQLIERAKDVIEAGIGTKDGGACLAEDFEFCAAVVGPIGRDEYLAALDTFKLQDAFPNLNPQYYGFRVDPFQTNRVWFQSRSKATHTGPLLGKPPTGKELELPPQLFHLDFTEAGLVREIGFYVVDRRQGNTGGLGGAFGYFYGTGNPLPIPECQPYKPSRRFRLLNWIGRMQTRLFGGKTAKAPAAPALTENQKLAYPKAA